jgi:hypothetical protein
VTNRPAIQKAISQMSPAVLYDCVITICKTLDPLLVYVPIGCENDTDKMIPQFVKDWTVAKDIVIIPIDPRLKYRTPATDIMILPVTNKFDWGGVKEYQFIQDLTSLRRAHVIVHDFTRRDYLLYYPYTTKNMKQLLFDVTYGDKRLSFDRAVIHRDKHGDFLQPLFMPLWSSTHYCSKSVINRELRGRTKAAIHIKSMYDKGYIIADSRLYLCYGIPPSTRELLFEIMSDVASVRRTFIIEGDIYALVDRPGDAYERRLRDLIGDTE